MTSPRPADPLLNAARIITYIALGVVALAMVALVLVSGAMSTFGRDELIAEMAKVGAPFALVWELGLAMILMFVLIGLAMTFLRTLLGIINSVGDGEPFHPGNAKRLSKMGWLVLAGQVITIPLAGISRHFAPYAERSGHDIDFGFGLDLGSILLILILFILARVFRKGAEMQEELEGTV